MAWSATFAASVAVGLGLVAAHARRERRNGGGVAGASPHPNERRFGLLAEETPAQGLQRIALGQLDLAIELLRDGSSPAPEEAAVHETRKALKRLRALMRLLEGELGGKAARRERAALRAAGARLAGARDAEVMVSTLDALLARHPRKLERRRGLLELRAQLERERRKASARTLGDAATRERVARELLAVRARVTRWELQDHSAGKLTGAGLERIYRRGCAGRRRAGRRKSGARALHRWRKHVKDLRYALEVLDVREHPSGAAANGRTAKLARRADELGEVLGEEHDLMLLAERVRRFKPLKRRRRTRRLTLRAISQRRARLRARALRDGEQLYARKPRRFLRSVRA
jgi:CHAD domain-containing protein